jgi:hypothetical protein
MSAAMATASCSHLLGIGFPLGLWIMRKDTASSDETAG